MHGYTLPLVRVLSGAQVILTAQTFSLLELPLPAAERPMANRIGLLFDVDRDERIVDVLVALSYRDMRARAAVVAIGESKGVVTAYVGGPHDPAKLHAAIAGATEVAVRPDRWTLAPLQVVPLKNGKLDHANLPDGHPLHTLPRRLPCGLVLQ